MIRAAPGPQLSTGRLRVDAARAIAKLREYQLVDRTAWVLEAIRAAVASGATAVSLDGDANDVWLRWSGAALPAEELPRLFDELVSPEPARASQHLRLLAAAVNSALGLRPAYVDVLAIAADGAAQRVRFTPDVLEEVDALGDAPLRELEVEAVTAPDGAPVPGMVVHLHRRLGLDTLGYLLREPPELPLARRDARDLAVPLRIGDDTFGRDAPGRDVARVPLGQDLGGWIALTDPDDAGDPGAVLEVAEHGVVLARYALELVVPQGAVAVPARLFVDAPRMPTNASRSEVRRGAHPIAAAEARARELVPRLIAALVEQLRARPDEPRLRTAALALISAAIHGPEWSWRLASATPATLAPLVALPLVRNAVGQALPCARAWLPFRVHTGDEPFDAELAPWFADVLWIPPGDAAERLVRGVLLDRRELRRHARFARRQLRAQQKFGRHARRAARLAIAGPLVILPIGAKVRSSCVPDAVFDGVEGEVGIFAIDARRGDLTLLLDGRDIEVMEHASPIRFTAVADSPRLTPELDYVGVRRDAELQRVEAAVHATVVRAAETLALRIVDGELPDGAQLAPPVAAEVEDTIIRRAIGLADQLGYPVTNLATPLAKCPAWMTSTGERVSLAQLRGKPVGVTAPGSGLLPPAGRIVVAVDGVDRALLRKLLTSPVIDYDLRRPPPSIDRALDLGRALVRTGSVALVIREPGIAAAIAPSSLATVILSHAGVELGTMPYPYTLTPCTIAIDADAAVPNATWSGALDDGGIEQRDHTAWERALVVAIARAICGEASPELLAPAWPRLDDPAGQALLHAIAQHDDVLDADLAARLRARPLLAVLGGTQPVAIDDLPAGPIYTVAPGTPTVAGDDFQPVIATPLLAAALARLAGRPVESGLPELTRRRDALARSIRRAALLGQVAQPFALPHAPAMIEAGRLLVGVGSGELAVDFRIAGRTFQTVTRRDELPLVAVIELEEGEVAPAFDVVPPDTVEAWLAEVRAAAAALLSQIAQRAPALLADEPRTLGLLGAWLTSDGSDFRTLEALRAAQAWPTVQGPRVALAALQGAVRIAAWDGDWLGELDGEAPEPLDAPVVRVQDPQVRAALERLVPGLLTDVTDGVRGLQAQRRMARGLLPAPAIPMVSPHLRRPLAALGGDGRALGAGEIALSLDDVSTVHLHAGGVLTAITNVVGVVPPVHLAIERPDLVTEVQVLGSLDALQEGRLVERIRPAAAALARELAREQPGDQLAPTVRRHLCTAVMTQWLTPDDVEGVLVLESTDRRWWPWSILADQQARFGDVWWTSRDDTREPLTENRLAFRLDAAEATAAGTLGFAMVDAAPELALDAEARQNRARPAATSLDLTFAERQQALTTEPLVGDGETATRGVVAPLAPQHAEMRRVRPHLRLFPFDPVDDPCAWPTLAVVDDARLKADRTWSVPVGDGTWQEASRRIREASEHALRALVPVSEHALASRWIGPELYGGVSPYASSGELQIRGALWLIEPTERGVVVVHRAAGQHTLPIDGAPMAGRLYVHATRRKGIEELLQATARRVYALLLADAKARLADSPALVTAHVARGLVLGVLRPEDARGVDFACFHPRSLDAASVANLLRTTVTVEVLAPGDDGAGLVDDGTTVSRILIDALGARASRIRRSPPALPGLPPEPAPPPPRHPLDELAAAVELRLADAGVVTSVHMIDEPDPVCFVVREGLALAAGHPLIAEVERRRAGDPRVVDALAAHALTVLNRELADVNDVTEAFGLARLLG